MEVPEAKEYSAILVGSHGRILLRTEPGLVGGFFIRVEPPADKLPERAIIDSVFNESGLTVRVDSVGPGVSFGARGTCGYFVVKIVGSVDPVALDGLSVDWYGFEEATALILGLKNDDEFECEMSFLMVASRIVESSGVFVDDKFKGVIGTSEFEDFKRLCVDIERILSGDKVKFLGGGISSDLVIGILDETQSRINSGKIDSGYEQNVLSLVGRNARTKEHEHFLIEAILILSTKARGLLLSGEFVACSAVRLDAVSFVKQYDLIYPGDGRARRERGFKGGKGKAKTSAEINRKICISDDFIRQAILSALRGHVPYRARVNNMSVVDMIVDEVFQRVKSQGVERNRDDLRGCILNMLVGDVVARAIIESR